MKKSKNQGYFFANTTFIRKMNFIVLGLFILYLISSKIALQSDLNVMTKNYESRIMWLENCYWRERAKVEIAEYLFKHPKESEKEWLATIHKGNCPMVQSDPTKNL